MGQYWLPVNLDKKEFIHPHKLASGLKLWEQVAGRYVGSALIILVSAMPEYRGGGDLEEHPAIGRWAGDRIALVGDYAESSDLPLDNASEIWDNINKEDSEWVDISLMVCDVIEKELEGKFVGDGWRKFEGRY